MVVAGCVAQQEGQSMLRRVPEEDIVMGKSVCVRSVCVFVFVFVFVCVCVRVCVCVCVCAENV